MGLEAAGLPDTLELPKPPFGESIVVEVDGIEFSNREIDGGIYDPAHNVLVFNGRAISQAGRLVSARYRPLTGA